MDFNDSTPEVFLASDPGFSLEAGILINQELSAENNEK